MKYSAPVALGSTVAVIDTGPEAAGLGDAVVFDVAGPPEPPPVPEMRRKNIMPPKS